MKQILQIFLAFLQMGRGSWQNMFARMLKIQAASSAPRMWHLHISFLGFLIETLLLILHLQAFVAQRMKSSLLLQGIHLLV